jgi:hypothetical protein
LDKKIIGVLLIAILTVVLAASLSYVLSQPNPNQNIPAPTPTPLPTPVATPSPSPRGEPTKPASTSTPSVPEFTVTYVDYSYDVPPTYEIDQFTGQKVIQQEGEHVDNRSAVFAIRNQPFATYVDSGNNSIGLYYNFRYKGHFGSDWGCFPFSEGGQSWRYHATFFVFIEVPPDEFSSASNSEYTDIVLRLPFLFGYGKPPMNTQVDFQVQALIGHIDYEGDGYYRFTGERSAWSSTQTITIP